MPKLWHFFAIIMPKAQNLIKTEHLTISTTPPIVGFLTRLVATGLYGKNHAEAAERLLSRAIEELIANDFFSKIPSPSADLSLATNKKV
jgi:hypothetical protein